ncbi:DUF5672 family protein [Paraglaciecola sp.]|uniref:DUF5672 family protein n=1 Tax=Paraglaciecola sp. TaxID=1920173 RepID=UPI0030F43EA8
MKFISKYYDSIKKSSAEKILIRLGKTANEERNSLIEKCLHETYQLSDQHYKDKPDFETILSVLGSSMENVSPISDKCFGLIVEFRKHNLLDAVISNFIAKTDLVVQLYHGSENKDYIAASKTLQKLIEQKKLFLVNFGAQNINASTYNALFLNVSFWKSMLGRNKVFVFQTDSYLCNQSQYMLSHFLNFDYIGSWWPRLRPVGLTIDGGNGGLSIRDWHKSTECLQRFSPDSWKGGEDGYFAFHIQLIGGNVAKSKQSVKFSTQYFFKHNSYGCHKISCLSPKDLKRFLNYSPESEILLTD